MPIRIHELLLSLAGGLDDDALADARQMLASAEMDRSLEFVVGCLAAGRVVLSGPQHRELEQLFADTYLDPSVIDRVIVRDPVPPHQHRFAAGAVDGREPEHGVADAVRPVLDVLPDVRSVWCVWRLTPAGPVTGPVPHRVVLVGVGPGGFAPATAYRVEYALRRAGIHASVEVLVDGNEPGEYHQEAMRFARQVPFAEHETGAPAAAGAEAVERQSAPVEPEQAPAAAPSGTFAVEPPRIDAVRSEPPLAAAPAEPAQEPQRPQPPRPQPQPRAELAAEPPRTAPVEPPVELPAVEPAPGFVQERPNNERPADLPAPALNGETPTSSTPSPKRRARPEEPKAEPRSRPRLVPAAPPADDNQDKRSPSPVDDMLNTQERHLLKELQDELARRETQDQNRWQVDQSGRHGRGPFEAPQRTGPMIVNGVPPHHPDQRGGYPPAT